MALSEFGLIQRYFSAGYPQRSDVRLGVGDDAALLEPRSGQQLAMSLDTLVEGVHFPVDTAPEDIAYKALAVNLSDMAALGAEPNWMLLALTLPDVTESWLDAFSTSLAELAAQHGVALVGGDTTKGSLAVSIQLSGYVPPAEALTRRGAKPGDRIYVTGTIGDAGIGLQLKMDKAPSPFSQLPQTRYDYFVSRLQRPTARVGVGLALRGLANAAIDISDGLAADLGHILACSDVGASLNVDAIPLSPELRALDNGGRFALTAGDDYELCFTVSVEKEEEMLKRLASICPVVCIGQIEPNSGLRLKNNNGEAIEPLSVKGYQHFE